MAKKNKNKTYLAKIQDAQKDRQRDAHMAFFKNTGIKP